MIKYIFRCGLIALSIATSITDHPVNVDYLFETAASKGYTKQGEMFSTESLADLTQTVTSLSSRIIDGGLSFHSNCILHSLSDGGLLLVPYPFLS